MTGACLFGLKKLDAPASLKDSMIYSLNAGGKRIRPLLFMATLKSFGHDFSNRLDLACAIEMLHTYSLIHDDLPAMDDDDLRRGKPTNHKVFGEATAILAGDALLTYSFQIIAEMEGCTIEQKVLLFRELAQAAGPEGMIAGQIADLAAENTPLSIEELASIHHNKTGALLTFSVVAGAVLAGENEQNIENVRQFARELGLVFQIKDDILDVEGDVSTIGKPVGSDDGNNKSTYPSLLGLEGAKRMMEIHKKTALEYLQTIKMEHELLQELMVYVTERDH